MDWYKTFSVLIYLPVKPHATWEVVRGSLARSCIILVYSDIISITGMFSQLINCEQRR